MPSCLFKASCGAISQPTCPPRLFGLPVFLFTLPPFSVMYFLMDGKWESCNFVCPTSRRLFMNLTFVAVVVSNLSKLAQLLRTYKRPTCTSSDCLLCES